MAFRPSLTFEGGCLLDYHSHQSRRARLLDFLQCLTQPATKVDRSCFVASLAVRLREPSAPPAPPGESPDEGQIARLNEALAQASPKLKLE